VWRALCAVGPLFDIQVYRMAAPPCCRRGPLPARMARCRYLPASAAVVIHRRSRQPAAAAGVMTGRRGRLPVTLLHGCGYRGPASWFAGPRIGSGGGAGRRGWRLFWLDPARAALGTAKWTSPSRAVLYDLSCAGTCGGRARQSGLAAASSHPAIFVAYPTADPAYRTPSPRPACFAADGRGRVRGDPGVRHGTGGEFASPGHVRPVRIRRPEPVGACHGRCTP